MHTSAADEEHRRKFSPAQIKLTERESELALLIMKGLNNSEIADVMHVAEGTTRNYISNLYGKLGVVDRGQAIIRLRMDRLGGVVHTLICEYEQKRDFYEG